ncbi:sister chromatid cohesion protein Dcc1 [Halteromyces radiatus]|uniref:sister chromatid cohesion protein Dcc1 n=1 Tax=Halteromyces radiatus TaxID=101107 RepID=UPI00222057F4|nr:sister chromatid cohesion protein Dcc1 [Halteromyces radiatus]KAI8096280.1 sister chromatid cohesion protein Dcc1 [Halteromyces radiatus]
MPDLVYSSNFCKDSFKLIELGDEQLIQAFESGTKVTIKGLPDDEAVLCTETATYSVRQVNTSNSMILCTPNDNETVQWQVCDDLSNTIELLPCQARTGRLTELLSTSLYTGPDNEDGQSGHTFEYLLSTVQASPAELKRALEERHAFMTEDGCYRCIDNAFLHQMLDGLATSATILGYNVCDMTLEEANQCLDQDFSAVPLPVRMAFLHCFVKDVHASQLCLDEYRVCRFLGSIVLEMEKGREWKMEDFMETWGNLTRLVLEHHQPTLTTLAGLYYTTERQVLQQPQIYITFFPSSDLPTDPAERFTRLFREKQQWSPEDIYPYVDDLARDDKHRDALLLKFTRIQKLGNKTVYGSRIK